MAKIKTLTETQKLNAEHIDSLADLNQRAKEHNNTPYKIGQAESIPLEPEEEEEGYSLKLRTFYAIEDLIFNLETLN